ncbi:T9SS type A sorting domain-containing protein [Spirosoma sp. BT702]|uniref:T9SS type A sorting domain-containing protein n=1 Tax=Spirosoma profusum TaxID=2771354 RepID=A0A926XU81_9BACT|nr:T9SS type A sorting domain-containing protein [Spirosoma profusum]MBD2700059.1 T9SS type A sorting domain-containing protein [Spirosoma profusum]
MKKTVFSGLRFVPALLLAVTLSGVAIAQKKAAPSTKSKDDNSEVHVRIIERNGDDVREIDRTYQLEGKNDSDRDKVVMKLVDSLKATRKGSGRRQMTIIVDEDADNQIVTRDGFKIGKKRAPGDVYVYRGRSPKNNRELWDNNNWRYEFRQGFDSLTDRMNRFRYEFPKDFDQKLVRPFEEWSRNFNGKPSTIRSLDAYPNNPDRDQLNVRFTAPGKGDVTIIVTNPKGKEIARREIKDFSGEFVGQIDLGSKSQGTFFITVTQNEDGAVKRIVVD